MSKVTPICLMNGKPPRQTCVYLSSSLRGQDRSILYYNLGRACQDTPLWGGRSAASWSTLGFADSCLTLRESKTLGNTPNNRLFKSGMLNCPASVFLYLLGQINYCIFRKNMRLMTSFDDFAIVLT